MRRWRIESAWPDLCPEIGRNFHGALLDDVKYITNFYKIELAIRLPDIWVEAILCPSHRVFNSRDPLLKISQQAPPLQGPSLTLSVVARYPFEAEER